MKSIGDLVRGEGFSNMRRTFGNANMVRRKDLRRIKRINIYNKEISGEQNPNNWFTPKRLKAMGNNIESAKNNHIGTNPIPKETQQEILKVMSEMSEYQYWNYRNRQQQLVEFQEKVGSCDMGEVIGKMPAKLRKELMSQEEKKTPEILEPLLKYSEQLQVYLPQDERYRYNLMLKINHPPAVKMENEE